MRVPFGALRNYKGLKRLVNPDHLISFVVLRNYKGLKLGAMAGDVPWGLLNLTKLQGPQTSLDYSMSNFGLWNLTKLQGSQTEVHVHTAKTMVFFRNYNGANNPQATRSV